MNDKHCEQMTDGTLDPRVERTRSIVVAAAAELLLEHGPDAITHQQVAQAASVSRTTVYKHWPERSDLLRATIEEIEDGRPGDVAPHAHVSGDLRQLLSHLADDLRDDGRAKLVATMIERSQHDPAVAAVRDSMAARITQTFGEMIDRAIARGELADSVHPERALASLAGALLFSRLLANRTTDDEFIDGLIRDFIAANAPP